MNEFAAVETAQKSVIDARRTTVATEQLEAAVVELRTQAVAITEHLVILSRLPFAKRQVAYLPLRSQVDDVEKLASQIGISTLRARGHDDPADGLRDIASRLKSLNAARAEAASELPEMERRHLRERLDAAKSSSLDWIRKVSERGTGE